MGNLLQEMRKTDFSSAYQILEESFPPFEYLAFDQEYGRLTCPNFRVYLHQEPGQPPNGLIAAWDFADFRYIEHFAVRPAARGSGLGSRMLAEYVRLDARPIYLEVEAPDNDLALRRVQFYQRAGFHLNPYQYQQPALRAAQPGLLLCVMTYPAPLDEATYLQYQRTLFASVYPAV